MKPAKALTWAALTKTFPRVPANARIEETTTPAPPRTAILTCAFSPDGKRVAWGAGGMIPGSDGSVRIHDAKTGAPVMRCSAHVHGLFSVAFQPNTGLLATASFDYAVHLYDLVERDVIFLRGEDDILKLSVAFATDVPWLVIGEGLAYGPEPRASRLVVLDLATGEERVRRTLPIGRIVTKAALSPDGALVTWIAASADSWDRRSVHVVDTASKKKLWRSDPKRAGATDIAFAGDSLAVLYPERIELDDPKTGELLVEADLPHCQAVAVAPDGHRFAIGTAKGITILRLAKKKISVERSFDVGSAMAVAWSPDGKRLAAGVGRDLSLFDV